MGSVLSTQTVVLLFSVLFAGLYYGYRKILPAPLPGIPYNRDAAGKILGDIPEMISYVLRTKRIFCWLTSLNARHNSPIVQAFIKPGSLPWVVINDAQESQDILLRRGKEFDRSDFFGEVIGGIIPLQHIQFKSSDSRFKNNRNLINHLMAPTFVTQISAPEIYESVVTLIKVWQLKCEIADGRPFSAHNDITYVALDSIFASSFGLPEEESITIQRLEAVRQWEAQISENRDEPVQFPDGKLPDIFAAIITLTNSVMNTQTSPVPRFTSWVERKLPYMRKAKAIKDKYITDKVNESERLINNGDENPRSALHSVLLREREVASKEGRQPDYHKQEIADEFFGFTLAGHDTSATTVSWGVKLLTDNPRAQTRLREAMRAALPEAVQQKRNPTYQELAKTSIPYLDAVIEEVLRHANTIAFVVREALKDTTVLGCHIPKGTNVFMMANGANYLEENMSIDDEKRSPGARRSNGKALTGSWDNEDIAAFKPERWLKMDTGTGAETFDPMAGPTLAFGLGSRGCYGKKLAYQALRIQFALILWHFQLLPVPVKLGGYEAVQRFAREPIQCYISLANVNV